VYQRIAKLKRLLADLPTFTFHGEYDGEWKLFFAPTGRVGFDKIYKNYITDSRYKGGE
jgi:hypothetical protein